MGEARRRWDGSHMGSRHESGWYLQHLHQHLHLRDAGVFQMGRTGAAEDCVPKGRTEGYLNVSPGASP